MNVSHFYQRLTYANFTFEVVIHIRRVEVRKAAFKEQVNHFFELLHIYRALIVRVQKRQTHTAESELFSHLIHFLKNFCPKKYLCLNFILNTPAAYRGGGFLKSLVVNLPLFSKGLTIAPHTVPHI